MHELTDSTSYSMGVAYNIVWSVTQTTYHQNSFWKNNLYHWWNKRRMSQKLTLNQRMFWILGGNKWAKFQTKAQKSSDVNVNQEIWWHIWETRRFVLYLGDSLIIRGIFRTCKLQVMHNFGNWMHIMVVQFLFRFLFWSALVHSNMWSSTVWTCNTGISCSFVQCFGWVYVKLNPVTLSLLSYLLQ